MRTYLFLVCLCFAMSHITQAQDLKSPNGKFALRFSLQSDGTPAYSLQYKGKEVIKPSKLGFELKRQKKDAASGGDMNQKVANAESSLHDDFTLVDTKTSTFDETWTPVWGEVKAIRNHYNEMAVTLSQKGTNRQMLIRFRLFDEGLGFRYEFPHQKD